MPSIVSIFLDRLTRTVNSPSRKRQVREISKNFLNGKRPNSSAKGEGLSFFAVIKYCLLPMIFLFLLNDVCGEIKNGYERDIFQMRESLRKHQALLHENDKLNYHQRRKIQYQIDSLVNHIANYELTENMLTQFRIIAPDLYAEIDTLRDISGRSVHIYVKFIPKDETIIKAWGTTYMRESRIDKNAFCSEYGMYTVSVKIWIVNKALFVLAHELGHVKHQVPHFSDYMEYYKNNYIRNMYAAFSLGHNTNDPSGRSASQYVRRFRKEYISVLKMKNEKVQSPLVVMDLIRKNLSHDGVNL